MATVLEPHVRGPLMPRHLDEDGRVCWWVLGAIGRINGDDRWADITAAELEAFDDADWDGLAADTAEIDGPISATQRARIVATVVELEAEDRSRDDRWWDR